MTTHPVPTTWGYIKPGALVQGADGAPWRVIEQRTQLPVLAFLVWDGADKSIWVTKGYDDEVVLLDEQTGRAVALVADILGAELVLDPLPYGPDSKFLRSQYLAHLRYHHGRGDLIASAESRSNPLEDLVQLHAIEHSGPLRYGIPHTHGRAS